MSQFIGRFSGRTAVITGGASGLGKAAARRIVQEGGAVSLWDVNRDALNTARAEVGAAHIAEVDVSDHAGVVRAAKDAHETLGRIEILINSAGVTGATVPVEDFPIDSWHRTFAINVNGVFFACREILPYMLANGYGRIVNVASVAGKEGNPNASAYSASKAAVIGFTKSLGKELAQRGILANAITPATFESPLLEQLPQPQVDYMLAKIPMGRLGTVEESATMICFMASEECSFTTASVFDTSGGRTTF
jgi:NAD(P)-dependent dehydrogenase (short-subunit alcohol dehydrogenase family)